MGLGPVLAIVCKMPIAQVLQPIGNADLFYQKNVFDHMEEHLTFHFPIGFCTFPVVGAAAVATQNWALYSLYHGWRHGVTSLVPKYEQFL